MIAATDEMRAAMDFLRMATGEKFHRTREEKLDCGCWVIAGWNTETYEPGGGYLPCGDPAHKAAAKAAVARFDPEEERFADVPIEESLATMLREEIERTA